jgi:membrane protein DedA with SNARE-associated domain
MAMESFLTQAGYAAIIVLGFLEACCIPIPSEVTFGFAGVLAYEGHLNLALVIIIGTLAELAGSYAAYAIGRAGERPVVERLGKYALITRKDIDRAERFLAGRGAWTVAAGRMLPVIRAFVSIVAGLAEVPAVMFGVLSLIGTAIYVTAFSLLGYALGTTWPTVSRYVSAASYVIVALVIVVLAGLILHRLREVRREAAATAAATAPAARPETRTSSRGPDD